MEEAEPTRVPFEKWKQGHDSEFTVLHHRFEPRVRARVLRNRAWPVIRDHCEVDDVVQQVWARAVPALKTRFEERGPGSLGAFLDKMTDDEVVDQVRRHLAKKRGAGEARSIAAESEIPDAAGPVRAATETPTGFARSSELRAMAASILGERERQAWELVEMDGRSSLEAAGLLDCSDAAVRSLLLRARAKLAARNWTGQTNPPNA